MSDPRFPNIGDPETWGPFDPNHPFNAAVETERKLALRHVQQRLRKRACDPKTLFVGMTVAAVQTFYATLRGDIGTPLTDDDRARLHEILDFAIVVGIDGWDHGETRQ